MKKFLSLILTLALMAVLPFQVIPAQPHIFCVPNGSVVPFLPVFRQFPVIGGVPGQFQRPLHILFRAK